MGKEIERRTLIRREKERAREADSQAEAERGRQPGRSRERQRDRQRQRETERQAEAERQSDSETARDRGLFADPFSYIGQRDSSEEIFVKVPVNDVVVKRFSRTIRVHGTVSITGTDACA